MDWIGLAEDGDHWRALVITAMSVRDAIKCWEILE
jgi:hypothetical protein